MEIIQQELVIGRIFIPKVENLTHGILNVPAKVDGCSLVEGVVREFLLAGVTFGENGGYAAVVEEDPKKIVLVGENLGLDLVHPHFDIDNIGVVRPQDHHFWGVLAEKLHQLKLVLLIIFTHDSVIFVPS